jgi:peptidoglycan/LPS O-acetylase OafA/YrhL
VAVFLVFLTHFGNYILPSGLIEYMWSGVDLFFVLSGFLITGILYDSLHDPHYFRNFYIRRALRIFPIFYCLFLLLFLLTPILHLVYAPTLLFFSIYIGNLIVPFIDLANHNPTYITWSFHGHNVNGNIGHLWSLCVEEQFYMLWPAVIWLVRSRTRLMWICALVSLAVLIERIYFQAHLNPELLSKQLLQWSTYTRIDTLLIGAWFALWLRGRALSIKQLRRLAYVLFFVPLGILVVRMASLSAIPRDQFVITVGYTLIALLYAGVLLRSLDDASHLSRILRNRYFNAFGAVSYGFYLIHHIFLYEVRNLVGTMPWVSRITFALPFIVFGISLLLAKLSFRYLESPFLRMKSKLAPQWVPTPTPMGESAPAPLHLSEPRP